VRQETDADGQVTALRSFDPWGVPLGEDSGQPFGYAGEAYDAGVQLTWLRARWLSEAQGRFFQPDSFHGDPGGRSPSMRAFRQEPIRSTMAILRAIARDSRFYLPAQETVW
jgi:RHS repeat-associated protein